MRFAILIALLWATNATAGTSEFSLELGNLQNSDPAYDIFSRYDGTPSQGLRLGIGIRDRLSVIGSWHHSSRGAEVYYESYYYDDEPAYSDEPYGYEEEYDNGYLMHTKFNLSQYQIGLKSELKLFDWLFPYFTGQGIFAHGTMRFDDDTSTRSNAGQIRRDGFGGGFMGTAGADFRLAQKMLPFTLGLHIEGGYAWISPMKFTDVGSMQPKGGVLRSGLGIRF
jgi:hypothetical protein